MGLWGILWIREDGGSHIARVSRCLSAGISNYRGMIHMNERMTEPKPATPPTGGFPHAMLREIYEQPEALAATIERYVPGGATTAETFQPVAEAFGRRERLVIAASGSSRHAGLAGEIML